MKKNDNFNALLKKLEKDENDFKKFRSKIEAIVTDTGELSKEEKESIYRDIEASVLLKG